MGELIRREASSKPLDFSGERLTAAVTGQVEIEHYHRYLLAREYCRNLDVLDCASGEGYGAALLAQVARCVIGVEIDEASVAAARIEFSYPNLSFLQGDVRALPLPDASIDVAVSFETLEHLVEQDQFLSELRRVLRPNGLLIISTPDRDIYSLLGTPPNPFHRLELTRSEFEALLQRHFSYTVLAGQRAMIGSVIVGADQDAPTRSFERRGETHIEGSDHLPRAMYLLALASNVRTPPLRNSLYVYRNDIDTDPQVRAEAELGRQTAELALLEVRRALTSEQEAARAQIAEFEQRLIKANAHAQEIETRRETNAEQAARARIAQLEQLLAEASAREIESQAREKNASKVITTLQQSGELLQAEVRRTEHNLAEVEGRATYLGHRCAALEEQLASASIRADQAERLLADTAQQLAAEAQGHAEARREANISALRLSQIETSSTWRASYPVRRLGSHFPFVARAIRVSAKLAWWTVTLQLRRRYSLWREYRAGRPVAPALEQLPPPAPDLPTLPLPADIRLPHSRDPAVSVIISTYGQLDVTLGCLRSIANHPPSVSIEVIVVDDAYPGPEDMGALGEIPGVLLLKNAANLGFLRSCNKAARVARGRYIHMLNNDTEVQPDSIDALSELLDARPDVGMVGSKLVFPDGRLQEAGGILWADGTGWNCGRGENPDRPEFNYVREVDYCSGASIMVRRHLFESLDGFDELFAPAYYEDADLAFRIRAQGQKVVYEPRSTVVHYEGVSHGSDLTSGIKAHQVINQDHMLARWRETFVKEHFDSGKHVMRARDRAKNRKIILVIEHYALEPDRDAGSRSTMSIIDSLIDAGWIVKFWPLNRAYSPVYTTAMERRGIEMLDHRWPGDFSTWMRENGTELDHILVVRPDTAAATLPDIMANTDALLSFYGVDLHFARVRRQALLDGNLDRMREASSLERLERRVWRNFDLVIYPSEEEAAAVREMSPTTLVCGIIPFCFDVAPPRSAPTGERNVLFVAGFAHPPNVDAAMFLVTEIIPKLESQIGPVKLTLAGSNPTEQVRKMAGSDVTITGYVTDDELGALYASHRVCVVPLRFGAGVKGKVVEALSKGLPLVTTSTGAQGIEGLGNVVPIHDDAEAIATALARLLTDNESWIEQSHKQTAFAGSRFSRSAMQRSVLRAFETGEESHAHRAKLAKLDP